MLASTTTALCDVRKNILEIKAGVSVGWADLNVLCLKFGPRRKLLRINHRRLGIHMTCSWPEFLTKQEPCPIRTQESAQKLPKAGKSRRKQHNNGTL